MRRFLTSLALVVLLVSSGSALPDNGVPDSVDLVYTVAPDFTTSQYQVQLDLYVFHDSNSVKGATLGFSWDNPDMVLDSAVAEPVTDSFDLFVGLVDGSIANSNANKRFQFAGAVMMNPVGIPAAPARQHWASYYFTMSDWQLGSTITVDTLSFGSILYKVIGKDPSGGSDISYYPEWLGPAFHHDSANPIPINLLAMPDSLYFEATEGGSNPTPQNFEVTTDGESVAFDVVDNISWAVVNPIVGTTPQTGLVSINMESLVDGVYVDSFSIVAPDADNSPQWVVVTLNVLEPPPSIGVAPGALFFNAVAGEPNPDDKFLSITNEGGGTLNWTVSNTEAWLSLAPTSGVNDQTVTLSVDITGMPFGDYFDTVIVTDPAADNDPVPVPVTLSIGSDLPIIEVMPAYNSVIVETPATTIDPVTIHIGNAGAGAMNFWIEEDSPRIVSFTPDSGAAPGDVVVAFDPAGGVNGQNFTDTAWVYSNEAINSPQPVVFWFHFVDDPAVLTVLRDTLNLTVYECSQGFGVPLPSVEILAYNAGGDNPITVSLEYDSTDFFHTSADVGILPENFTIFADRVDLPLGTYYDSVWVSAPKAAGSPHLLVIAYHMSAADEAAEIYLPKTSAVIVTRENSGPTPEATFGIFNANGGCMDFDIQEDIPWAFLEDQDGTAPASVDFRVNSSGFPRGTYVDSFFVYSAGATNSPQVVEVTMHVFWIYGDVNWDGELDIADLIYLVFYMFQEGPEPIPARIVGSMDCNPVINIVDLVWLAQYMFQDGPKPCGNP